MCDYGLKEMLMDGNGNVMPMASLYFMTDIGLYGKTDAGDMQDDVANKKMCIRDRSESVLYG